jgi:putative ABC transport system substrate-binding protein
MAEPHKPRVLLINSNRAVEKYRIAGDEFKKALSYPIREVSLEDDDVDVDALLSYNPDIIYCIGGKSYSFSKKHFSEKDIIFSSIINWLRLPSLSPKTYGVANELHERMPIFMFRSVFPGAKKIGILYSREYTVQWFQKTHEQAAELGIEIIGKMISNEKEMLPALKELMPSINALWLISDPLVMSEKKHLYDILEACNANKIPVFSYHEAFANLGVVLTVSVDDPTIGRQAAGIAMDLLAGNNPQEKVQVPAGSHITLNLEKVEEYGLEYNNNALGLVNNIIRKEG